MAKQLPAQSDWHTGIPRGVRGHTIFGYSLLAFATLGFGYWSNSAPIAGAVVAPGVFVATGQNKIVQHLEGGVIRSIRVHEGDRVRAGQLLVELDDTAPKAELQRLELRYARAAAIEARLRAEAHEREEITFTSPELDGVSAAEIEVMQTSQRRTFEARRRSQQTEIAALKESINAFEQRVAGTELQRVGVQKQLALIDQELEAKSYLLKKGMIRKPEVLVLERGRANLQGEAGRLAGEIGDAKEQIARVRQQIALVGYTAVKTAVEQLHETRAELSDLRERIHAARRILERISIVAPVSGIVVKLRYHTPGGVIEPGKNIMEIVPTDDELIIEVRVRPQDIEGVRRGQNATVRLTALNRRITPSLDGTVVYVSADAVPNEKAAMPAAGDVYVARIRLAPGEAAKVPEFVPTPGMPAEIYIKTEERTFLNYVLRPLRDSMARAFRES